MERRTQMIDSAQILRILHISWVLGRNGLDDVILAAHLFRPIRFVRYLFPWHWFRDELPPTGTRIRRALEELGPIFVKFGQNLSTRRDLLPAEVADELARLQDRVPPFPGHLARGILEKTYGKPIHEVFAKFDLTPFASASIAQVHAAELHDGRSVVVKVLRPQIEKLIRRDITLLYTIAGLADRYWKEGKRLRPVEVVAEYEKTIIDELDLLREAANASQLRRNFANSPLLYIPEIYWEYTRRDVMVMERIHGIPVGDVAALRECGVDLKTLSERGVEIFFTQVFRDNFFHADMHPGNIFVAPTGQYIAVDFGIMGTLSPTDQHYLAQNFVAFFNRDYRRVAELHVQSEWVPAGTRVDEFEVAIRSVCEPIFERPLKEISFGNLLLRLFQTARRFNMEVQPQLVLLQKTLLNIEGLGRQLNPDLDLWKTAKPFLERWMQDQVGPRAFFRDVKDNWPEWSQRMSQLPNLVFEVLQQSRDGKLHIAWSQADMERLQRELRLAHRRTVTAILGGSLIVAAAIIYAGAEVAATLTFSGIPVMAWVLGLAGALTLVFGYPTDAES